MAGQVRIVYIIGLDTVTQSKLGQAVIREDRVCFSRLSRARTGLVRSGKGRLVWSLSAYPGVRQARLGYRIIF